MTEICKSRIETLSTLIASLDDVKKNKNHICYARAFSDSDIEYELIRKFYQSSDKSIGEITIDEEVISDDVAFECIEMFLKWCNFSIEDEINKAFTNKPFYGLREQQIIKYRFNMWTLDDIGIELDLSKERIRQIENNVVKKFAYYFNKKGFQNKMVAELNGKKIFTYKDISSLTSNHSEELFYLLFKMSSKSISYCGRYNVLYLYEKEMIDLLESVISNFQKVVSCDEYSKIEDYCKTKDIDLDALDILFNLEYELKDDSYHKSLLPEENLLRVKSKNPKERISIEEREKNMSSSKRYSKFLSELDLLLRKR